MSLSELSTTCRVGLAAHARIGLGLISASLVASALPVPTMSVLAASRMPRLAVHSLLEHAQSSGRTMAAINIGTVILAEPAAETPFPIQIAMGDGIPKNSFVRIRGLPPSTALSEGHSIAPGAWAVPFVGLPTLRISVPVGLSGRSEITVALVTVDGAVLAEAKSALVIAPASLVAPRQPQPAPKSVASISPVTTPLPGAGGDAGSSAPARPTAPLVPERTEAQRQALRFVSRGHELLNEGDVAAARLYYQRAVDAGLHEGALALAASYDPVELERLGVQGLQPDLALARKWYEQAQRLGAPEAAERLRRLSSR
jgi:hypothetical protein